MAKLLKLRRGTSAQHGDDGSAGFTGAVGEVTVDTTDKILRVHDNSTKGGIKLAKATDVPAVINSDTFSGASTSNVNSATGTKNYIDLRAPIASPTFTGTVAIPNIANLESAVTANTAKVTNVTTNLSVTANGTSLTVASSDGTDASIPAVTTSAWGAMTDEDKTKLDGIATGATVGASLTVDNTWTGSQRGEVSDVGTKTGAFDFDLDTSNNFKVTVGATAEFGFSNMDAGQSGTIEVVNSGSYEMSWGNEVHFVGGTVPTITVSATSFLAYYCPSDSVVFVQHMLNVKQQGT